MAHDPPETILALAIGRNTARQRGQSARSDQCVDHVDTARSERHASRSKGRHHRARSADRRHHEHYYKLTAAATAAVAPGRYTDALRGSHSPVKHAGGFRFPLFLRGPLNDQINELFHQRGTPRRGPANSALFFLSREISNRTGVRGGERSRQALPIRGFAANHRRMRSGSHSTVLFGGRSLGSAFHWQPVHST